MAGAVDVSLLLLNYNGERFVPRCLAAIEALSGTGFEVIVTDNASTDGSAPLLETWAERPHPFPARFERLERNVGYAGGHNAAAALARGSILGFLNITTQPEPGWLTHAAWLRNQPGVAFVQPLVLHADAPDRIESFGSQMEPNGLLHVLARNRSFASGPFDREWEVDVFSVLGAAFFARADRFRELGGFDEGMFLYFEETDLCWRAWIAGARTVARFDPAASSRVLHAARGTIPGGFEAERRFDTNRTFAMLTNFSAASLPNAARNAAVVVSELARTPGALWRYAVGTMRRFPGLGERRRRVQATRRRSDAAIFSLGIPSELRAAPDA